MNVLGVKVDNLTPAEALFEARDFLYDGKQHKIFTPNPEMLVKAQKDEYFKKILNTGDLNLCDGFGISLFFKIKRIPGADFMLELCQLAEKEGRGIYLLGGGANEAAAVGIKNIFPNLKIAGLDIGSVIDELKIENAGNDETINKINSAKPDVLFVGFGMGKQEKWIHENLSKMPSVKVAMGVGGSLDFLSGKIKRAPCWMRNIGLEWLYRLFQEPWRFPRILNATIKFLLLVLKNTL